MNSRRDDTRLFWRRYLREVLWGIAIAGLLVSVLTGFKFTLLFLPLVFTTGFFDRRGSRD